MTKRVPPEGLTPAEHRRWLDAHKNRNRHSVKFPDDLEEDYEHWKIWANMPNDNAALRHLVSTHPDIKHKS